MAAITWPTVVALAAELGTVSVEAQQLILERANAAFNPSMFGGEDSITLKFARLYLAAHIATMNKKAASGAAGPVVSESIGGLSVTYAMPNAQMQWSGSAYGDQLTQLIQTSGARLPVVP